jgi:hypothetical protein
MIKDQIKNKMSNLGGVGLGIFLITLIFGLRTFWDDERKLLPHVMEFNMYLFSFQAEDGTDLPDVYLRLNGNEIFVQKAAIKETVLSYIHLSDRWDEYPPLFRAYFCSEIFLDQIGASKDMVEQATIKYYVNRKIEKSFSVAIKCK